MDGFNLVPEQYRQQRLFWSDIKVTAAVCTVLLSAAMANYGWISLQIKEKQNRLAEILESRKQIESTQAEMDTIKTSKRKLASRYALLKGLKGNISAQELFAAIDQSLSEDIEFDAVTFERDGEPVETETEPQQSSYFIMIPDLETLQKSSFRAWKIDASMTIRGRTRSHSALANFMTALAAQEQIENVELLRSGGKRVAAENTIDFDLLVIINNTLSGES